MKRVTVLDPLRGLASAAVMWFHLAHGSSYLDDGHWLDVSGEHGHLGVQVFFVISGFILPYALHARGYRLSDFTSFVANRVIRLDPPYFITIAGVIALTWASTFVPGWQGEMTLGWIQLAGHVGYVNAFIGEPWIVPVFWTLAIEFQFYLMLALVYPLLAHASKYVSIGTLAGLCGLAALVPHVGPTAFRPYVFQHIFLFGLGIAVFWYYFGRINRATLTVLLATCTAGVWLTLGIHEAIAGGATALVIAFAPGLRLGPILTYLGTISYSLYLVHLPIGDRVLGLLDRVPAIPKSIGLLAAIAASLLAADVLYRLVEKPSRKLSSQMKYRSARKREGEATSGPVAV